MVGDEGNEAGNLGSITITRALILFLVLYCNNLGLQYCSYHNYSYYYPYYYGNSRGATTNHRRLIITPSQPFHDKHPSLPDHRFYDGSLLGEFLMTLNPKPER